MKTPFIIFTLALTLMMGMIITPAVADSFIECLEFRTEWLYWKPCPNGVYAGLKGATLDVADFPNDLRSITAFGEIKNFDYDAHSGFRLGLTLQSPCCNGMSYNVNWVAYCADQTKKLFNDAGPGVPFLLPLSCLGIQIQGFAPQNPFFLFATTAKQLKSRWSLDLDLVDFDIAYAFSLKDCIFVKPFLGLRYGRIEQYFRWNFVGDGTFAFLPPGLNSIDYEINQKLRTTFKGFGPRLGIDLSWEHRCGWGFYCDVATSIVFGERDGGFDRNAFLDAPGIVGPLPLVDDRLSRDDISCSRIMTDLGIGLFWKTCIFQCLDTTFRLGWEHHLFYNQSVLDGAQCLLFSKEEDGDVSTQGLTFGLELGF